MSCSPRSNRLIVALGCCLILPLASLAQGPPAVRPQPKDEAPAKPLKPGEFPEVLPLPAPSPKDIAAIKPLPPVAIPDDPPPHEGAFFDLPMTIEPPDVIVVEVLEAMPGRPITGERLVRPDGTISLGFYGDVHVRGLTPDQAKVKVVHHLRKFLTDEVLGLVQFVPEPIAPGVIPQPEPLPPGAILPGKNDDKDPVEPLPVEKKEGRPSSSLSRKSSRGKQVLLRASRQVPGNPKVHEPPDSPPQGKKPEPKADLGVEMLEIEVFQGQGKVEVTQPADSTHVFVDFAAHNSHVYFVQGDVGVPGRLPFTGRETVLDGLNYAGGFIPSAEPSDVHLYRPARGDKPARDYKLDYEAIKKGVVTANLQLFPGDRIVVARNPIAAKNVEIDRATGLVNSMMNSMLQYSLTARTLGAMNMPPTGSSTTPSKVDAPGLQFLPPAFRDAMLKDWADYLWSITSKEGGAMVDEKQFKDALMKKLAPAPEPK